jgi:hypothetical protein
MQDEVNTAPVLKGIPCNKGKLTGAKPPQWGPAALSPR